MSLLVLCCPGSVQSTGIDTPIVEFEVSGTEIDVWVTTDAEIVDIVLLSGPHRRARTISSDFLAAEHITLATGELAAGAESFVAHALVLYAPDDESANVSELAARAFFVCADGTCTRSSYSDYMVSVGAARRTTNTEGERSIDFDLTSISVSQ